MKIIHALVGYLVVTALPFHPFAFAFRLPVAAIDYDAYGDVNTGMQNHIDGALASAVEACQTAPTQNHGDTALMKREPGDIIEERWIAYVPPVLLIIVAVAAIAVSVIWIKDDDPRREAFTQNTISKMMSEFPKFNWVICHSPYFAEFDGIEGTDWNHTRHEIGISFGRSIGYDLYWAKSGTFTNDGDGGFINWAYNGNIVGTDDGGSTVHFGTIS